MAMGQKTAKSKPKIDQTKKKNKQQQNLIEQSHVD